jgi:hypothetical protein
VSCVHTDCVRAVGGHYVSKDIEGKIVVWQAMDSEVTYTIILLMRPHSTPHHDTHTCTRSCAQSACPIVG